MMTGAILRDNCYCDSSMEITEPGDGNGGGPGGGLEGYLNAVGSADFPLDGSPESIDLFTEWCDQDVSEACVGLAVLHANTGVDQLSEAAQAAQRGCELGNSEGCFFLGAAYHTGMGVSQDDEAAGILFMQACEMGLQQGCEGPAAVDELFQLVGL